MQQANVPKYLVGGLTAVVLVGMVAWLIRSEGERTRQMLRDARQDVQAAPDVAPVAPSGGTTRRADSPRPAPDAPDVSSTASRPNQPKPETAATDPQPTAVEPPAPAEEDFNLDDHVVFPGLADEISKPQAKPSVDPTERDRKQ